MPPSTKVVELALIITIIVLAIEYTTTVESSQRATLGVENIIAIYYNNSLQIPDITIIVENSTKCLRAVANITITSREIGEQKIENIEPYCVVARNYTIYSISLDTRRIELEPNRSYIVFIDIAWYSNNKTIIAEELGPATLHVYSIDSILDTIVDKKLENLSRELYNAYMNTSLANEVQEIREIVEDYDTRLRDLVGRLESISSSIEELQGGERISRLEEKINLQYKLVLAIVVLQVLAIAAILASRKKTVVIEEIEA